VRSTGPILNVHINIITLINKTNFTNPIMPSIPWKPLDEEATPIDWEGMTRAGDKVTVSRSGSQKVC